MLTVSHAIHLYRWIFADAIQACSHCTTLPPLGMLSCPVLPCSSVMAVPYLPLDPGETLLSTLQLFGLLHQTLLHLLQPPLCVVTETPKKAQLCCRLTRGVQGRAQLSVTHNTVTPVASHTKTLGSGSPFEKRGHKARLHMRRVYKASYARPLKKVTP